MQLNLSKTCSELFHISSALFSEPEGIYQVCMEEQVASIIKSHYHICFFLFFFGGTGGRGLYIVSKNQMQYDKKEKSIYFCICNTRLSWKSLQISLEHTSLLQKLTAKMEVTEVTVKISWELVNPVNLFSNYCSNSMRGVVSVYYGNVIVEAGLGLQLLFVRRYCACCVWHSAPLLPLKWVLSLSL